MAQLQKIKKKLLLIAGLALTGLCGPVQAAAITNLSANPEAIEVKVSGGYREEIIRPGETLRIPGRIDIRHNGHTMVIEYDEEYAIWKDGLLSPQHSINNHFRGL